MELREPLAGSGRPDSRAISRALRLMWERYDPVVTMLDTLADPAAPWQRHTP
jgi:hypothetical protein